MDPNFLGRYFANLRVDDTTYLATDVEKYDLFYTLFGEESIVKSRLNTLPFPEVMDYMRVAACPLYGEFIETSENLEFMEISSKFFEYTFWNQHVYIGYDKKEERFLMLKKVKENDPEDKEFIDLLSDHEKRMVEIPFPEELIKHSWDGLVNHRFRLWYDFVWKYLMAMKAYHSKTVLYNKAVKRYVINQSSAACRVEEENLFNINPVLDIKGAQATTGGLVNEMTPVQLVDPVGLQIFLESIHKWYDRHIGELGRVANVNPGGARSTVGDNYLDTHAVKCRQHLTLTQLRILSRKVEKNWGITLTFEILGENNDTDDTGERSLEEKENVEIKNGEKPSEVVE